MGTAASVHGATTKDNIGDFQNSSNDLNHNIIKEFGHLNVLLIPAGSNKSNKIMQKSESSHFSCRVCDMKFRDESSYRSHIRFCASVKYIRCFQLKSDKPFRNLSRADKVAIFIHESLMKARHYMKTNGRPKTQKHVIQVYPKHNPFNRKFQMMWYAMFKAIKLNRAIAKTAEALTFQYRSCLNTQIPIRSNMLYDGSKLLWRTEESIDLNIYLHDDEETLTHTDNQSPVLEVVGFDVSNRVELMRLYVNFDIIRNHASVVEKIKAELLTYHNDSLVDTMQIQKDMTQIINKVVVNYVVTKLRIREHRYRRVSKILVLGDLLSDIFECEKEQYLPLEDEDRWVQLKNPKFLNVPSLSLPTVSPSHSSKALPTDALLAESVVLKAIRPVEIIRRRHTADENFNIAMNLRKIRSTSSILRDCMASKGSSHTLSMSESLSSHSRTSQFSPRISIPSSLKMDSPSTPSSRSRSSSRNNLHSSDGCVESARLHSKNLSVVGVSPLVVTPSVCYSKSPKFKAHYSSVFDQLRLSPSPYSSPRNDWS